MSGDHELDLRIFDKDSFYVMSQVFCEKYMPELWKLWPSSETKKLLISFILSALENAEECGWVKV